VADPSETTQVSETPAEVESVELLGAVRSLAAQVGSLQAEVQALRASGRMLPPGEGDPHGWDERPVARHDSPPWVRSLDSPGARRPAVPRLVVEIGFLVAVAVVAAIARLDAPVVILVMAGAWALVAAMEWAAAREAASRERALLRSGLGAAVVSDDASWFSPPADEPVPELAEIGEDTAARLPPPPED